MYVSSENDTLKNDPSGKPAAYKPGQFGSLNPKLYTLLIIIGAIQVLLIAYWIVPRAVSLYYQTRGGQIVDRVLSGGEKTQWDSIACASPPVANEITREILLKAERDLNQAIRFSPEDAHPHLLIGRAYCMLGEPEKAIGAYQAYVDIRPDNPLGHLELGFAYESACQAESDAAQGEPRGRPEQQRCEIPAYRDAMEAAWVAAGVTTQDFIDTGEMARRNGRLDAALHWFRRGSEFSPDEGEPWYHIGQIYTSKEEISISTDMYLAALALGYTESINALVDIYTNIGDHKTLVAILGRALDRFPQQSDDPEGSKIWDQIGRACQQTGISADPLCERFIEHNQGNGIVDPDLSTSPITNFWKRYQGLPGISYSLSECPELPGRACASITVRNPASEFTGAGLYQCMLLEQGKEYKYSAWMKVSVPDDGKYRKLYVGGTTGGRSVGYWATKDRSFGPLDWSYEEFTITAPNWDGQVCFHPIRLESEGTAWFYNPAVIILDGP